MKDVQPRETSEDILRRAVELLVQGLKAKVVESISGAPTPDPNEIMNSAQAVAETGYSSDSIAIWCQRGDIRGAWRLGRRGRWKFKRADFEAFIAGRRRRRRSLREAA